MNDLKIKPIPSEEKPVDKRLLKLKHKEILPKIPSNIMLLGRCGSGKSSALYTILNEGYTFQSKGGKKKSVFDEMIIYLGTMDSVTTFKKLPCKNLIVCHEFVASDFEEYLDDLKKHQMEKLEAGKPPLNVCIVFDDFVGMGLLKKSGGKASPLERLMLTSRHECNATVIFCSQTYKNNGLANPTVRNNVNYYFLHTLARSDVEKIAQEHCCYLTEDEFIDLYDHVHQKPYNFMMIDYKVVEDSKRFRDGFGQYIGFKKNPLQIERDAEPQKKE